MVFGRYLKTVVATLRSKVKRGRGSDQCSDTFRFSQSDFQEDEVPELSLE